MTSVSSSAVPAWTRAAPLAGTRNDAYDRARTFIILLVLIHHAVIPYTYFGHTDRQSFMGFDAVVIFNDSFFMSAMFFLSGMFVWPSLRRKGIGFFLRDRWWRLGLPFAVAAVILMPIAYYAVEMRLHDTASLPFGGRRSRSDPGQAGRPGSSGCCWHSMCWRLWYTAPRPDALKRSAACRSPVSNGLHFPFGRC